MAKKAKGPVDPLKAKEQRQKKLLIVLAPLFLLLLVVMVPKTMKRLHASSAPPAAPPVTATSTTSTSATSTTGVLIPNALIGATTTVSAGLSGDAPATAAVGQLASLGRFASKDPFAGPIALPGAVTSTTPTGQGTTTTTTTGTGGKGGNDGNGATTPPPTPPTPPVPAPTSAVIKVNGYAGEVKVGEDFPQPTSLDPTLQPIFHLVSLGQRTAKIAIVGGSYASGASTLTVSVGKPVTLLNKSDGSRYTIELMPQGTRVPTTTGAGGTTSTPAVTTTTSTGTTTSSSSTTTTGTTTTGGN